MLTASPSQIVNFRKIKQDFASQPLREGKDLYAKGVVKQAKIVQFGGKIIKVHAHVTGVYQNAYHCEMEIDRFESEVIDSSCDCPHNGDCQHLACLIYYLEEELEKLVFSFSQEKKKKSGEQVDKVVEEIEKKVEVRQKKEIEKQLLNEYITAAGVLGKSAFFVPEEELEKDQGELSFVLVPMNQTPLKQVELQLVLRLPFRSKPFYIQQPKQFFASVQAQEPIILGGRRLSFGSDSFGPFCQEVIKSLRPHLHFSEVKTEKGIVKVCELDREGLGEILAVAFEYADTHADTKKGCEKNCFSLPGLFWESIEQPLLFSESRAEFSFRIEYLTSGMPQLMLSPSLNLGPKQRVELKATTLFECSRPGVINDGIYFRFAPTIKRQHIHDLDAIHKMAIPEPLFGSFIENALPELQRFTKVSNAGAIDAVVTCPSPGDLKAICTLEYADGELEASLDYVYDAITVPDASIMLQAQHMKSFVTRQGILARNLVEENALVRDLFQGFVKDEKSGAYVAKNDKKIVEFMTEIVPQHEARVKFSYPKNLQNQFSYDDTRFVISLSEGKNFDKIKLDFKVEGDLKGCSVDYLWDSVSARRTYIVMAKKGAGKATRDDENELTNAQKILVLKLDNLAETLQIFDELQIKKLDDMTMELPLWVLVNLQIPRFEGTRITLKLTNRLKEIQEQIFDMKKCEAPELPKSIKATFRPYQEEGVQWLSRLRQMGLNGILADDMGLGKTLQAITAITHYHEGRSKDAPSVTLIVCPTSLVDNWKEEFHQFQPKLKVVTCTGTPQERKKILSGASKFDIIVTSYGLVQKDIELYEAIPLGYLVLDEAQHIKNRETRNARSVKKISARHKLILTGTPLENSLEDLWSLFDFLMPGILGSFERFVNSYVKPQGPAIVPALEALRKKVTPFVLRRMKLDVLKDLPPISHIVYNCRLSPVQQELYYSYAKSAKEQLTKLVEKEGFDKVRLQVLATLTRLKQICCHPGIFAKETVESGDSAKYEMLLDLLGSLIEAKHKTVVFSQYTQMLSIMKQDLQKMGVKFAYLDGSSKNRLSIVKQFNEDPDTSIFLVSLKVGGTGLNLVGADTVIHYDMWWNPAVENQATDRVWRMGQKQTVSSYKLVTLGTIEEKIVSLQERKKELLKEIVRTDEEVISKLTWDEVLELLKA